MGRLTRYIKLKQSAFTKNYVGFFSIKTLPLVAVAMFALGCETPEQLTVGNTDILVEPLGKISPSPSASPDGNAVCNPFNEADQSLSVDNGLKGSLYYLPPNLPQYRKVSDYQSNGIMLPNNLYFSQLNVPTRAFDLGFVTQNGTILETPNGDTLYEWFSLHFESEIRLRTSDSEGLYQFAILSDDGSILKINRGNGYELHIDNDGTHPTKLKCATDTVYLKRGDKLPIIVDYYQGPRYHIAMMLLWRKVGPDWGRGDLADPLCGAEGNSFFFDSTKVPSVPSHNWLALLGRGWKVVHPNNYYLPSQADPNPCVPVVNPPVFDPDGNPSPTPTPDASPTPEPSPEASVAPSPEPSPEPMPSPSPSNEVDIGFNV